MRSLQDHSGTNGIVGGFINNDDAAGYMVFLIGVVKDWFGGLQGDPGDLIEPHRQILFVFLQVINIHLIPYTPDNSP